VWRIKRERGCNNYSPLEGGVGGCWLVSPKAEGGQVHLAVALAEAEQGVLANTFVIPVPAYARINSGGNPVKQNYKNK